MRTLDLNQVFSAIASLAILLYLAPGVLRLGPSVRRYTQLGALALIGVGMALAFGLWLFQG